MKIQKGDAGYLRRRKRLLILEAVVSFGLVAALVIAGYVTTKTKLNLLTVVAVLGCHRRTYRCIRSCDHQ